jgi:glucose-1-phosphate adenylyltransferase
VLLEALHEDARDAASSHDFGRDVLPNIIGRRRVLAYDFIDENRKETRYWRDVGTLDAYYEANMDLIAVSPIFNLYDRNWPLRSGSIQYPPAKFVFADEGRRMGVALDSLVSQGCIVSGGRVTRCILSPGVRINSHCEIEDSILFSNVQIGRCSRIRRAIIDQDLRLEENTVVGFDPESDKDAGHFITESGVVVIHPKSKGVSVITPPRIARKYGDVPPVS